jgi:hypothetical protein
LGFRDVDEDRRAFLARLAAVGVASAAGCTAALRPAKAALEPEAGPYDVEVLEQPIVLRSGESLADRSFVLSQDFRGTSSNAIILVVENGVSIRNVKILGADRWDSHWDDVSPNARSLPGVFGNTAGIRIQNVRDVTVEQVSIEGLPRAGIFGFGIEGGLFRDITIRHCNVGINLVYNSPNRRLRFERVRTGSMWSQVDPTRPDDASLERPGGWIGGDGLALNSLRDSELVDCTAVGEMYGAFKMTNPKRVTVRECRGTGFQVQGIAAGDAGNLMGPARDVLIEDCVFDKGLGYSSNIQGSCGMQITYHVASTRIRRCLLNAAGQNGHGIQVTRDAHAQIEDCLIRGFNGVRGVMPAHALDIALGSTVNSDFAAVNYFVDQQRTVLDRNPVAR